MGKSKSKKNKRALKKRRQLQDSVQAEPADGCPNGGRGWIPKGQVVEFAGRRIPGMVYFGKPEPFICPYSGIHCVSRVFIDPSKKVSETGTPEKKLGFHSLGYGDMGPVYRRKYLDWLANGRSDMDCSIYFPVLYFYVLERRFFLGNPENQEKLEIIREIYRLKELYGFHCEIEGAVEHFEKKFFNRVNQKGELTVSPMDAEVHKHLEVLMPLCEKSVKVAPLDVDDFLKILHEIAGQKKSTDRFSGYWFEKLLRKRFARFYPNGYVLAPPTELKKLKYEACSEEFIKEIHFKFNGKPAYIVEDFRKEMESAQNFAETVASSLDKYKVYAERNPDSTDIKEALKTLPRELWTEFEKQSVKFEEQFRDIKRWAGELANSGSNTTVADVILKTGGRLFNENTIIDRDWEDARDFLALCGFGTAPDNNLRFRRDNPDEPAVIYELDSKEDRLSGLSDANRKELAEVSVGAYLLNAEKCSDKDTVEILMRVISQKEGLTADQKKGLEANLQCLLIAPHDKEYHIRLSKSVRGERKTELRRFIVDLAQRDEKIKAETVSAIEKVYAEFGWDASEAYADLHAGEIASNSVNARRDNASELDESRIKSIRSDTDKVSKVLGSIFTDADGAGKDASVGAHVFAKGLDVQHATLLLNLLEKDHWMQEEFEELVRGQGLLPAGAIETINEWTFEIYEESLLDEDNGYHIAPEIASALKAGFETGSQATGTES